MINGNAQRMTEWNGNLGENLDYTKKAILTILKDQKVSLSKIRTLFNIIIEEIEENNPINY